MRARMATIDHKILEISFSYIQWLGVLPVKETIVAFHE